MNTIQNRNLETRGTSFAVLLLTVGIIWMLFVLKLLSTAGIAIALSLWPLALVAVGVELLMRRRSPQTGTYIVLAIAVFVILVALLAPPLGIGVLETTTSTFVEQIDNAESATITLHPSVGQLTVQALETENVLFDAEATYIGDVKFDVHGVSQRQIDFGQNEVSTTGWTAPDQDLFWNIGLAPDIPLNLSINTGVGEANLDLTGLYLTAFDLKAGVSRVNLILPEQEQSYQVNASGGVGNFDVQFPENADVYLSLKGGVGEVRLDVPDDSAVRIRVELGLGDVNVPNWLKPVDLGTDEEIWQSNKFESATRRISVYIEGGLGGLTVR